ncbi:MAG TPA: ABC transporter permease subunit [Stellaceae bacterium]|nr:ABC transporter permease subunit [Stellaceae bacterium]
MNRLWLRISAPVTVGALFIALWALTVWFFALKPYVLPSPIEVAESLWNDGRSLLGSLLFTLGVTLAALAAAVLVGGLIAVLFSLSRLIEISFFPYIVILQVTPLIAIAPLLIIWVHVLTAGAGGGDHPMIALLVCAWIVAFFPIVANTTAGLNSADRNLIALFRLYGASRWRTLWLLRMPTALPYFLTGVRISGGLALIGAVAAEFVAGTGGAETGLAYRILEAQYRLLTARLFAALFLLSLTGVIIYLTLDLISRQLLRRWHESATTGELD